MCFECCIQEGVTIWCFYEDSLCLISIRYLNSIVDVCNGKQVSFNYHDIIITSFLYFRSLDTSLGNWNYLNYVLCISFTKTEEVFSRVFQLINLKNIRRRRIDYYLWCSLNFTHYLHGNVSACTLWSHGIIIRANSSGKEKKLFFRKLFLDLGIKFLQEHLAEFSYCYMSLMLFLISNRYSWPI